MLKLILMLKLMLILIKVNVYVEAEAEACIANLIDAETDADTERMKP